MHCRRSMWLWRFVIYHTVWDVLPSNDWKGIDEQAPNQWFRFIVPIFLHAGFVHILLNMFAQLTLSAQVRYLPLRHGDRCSFAPSYSDWERDGLWWIPLDVCRCWYLWVSPIPEWNRTILLNMFPNRNILGGQSFTMRSIFQIILTHRTQATSRLWVFLVLVPLVLSLEL